MGQLRNAALLTVAASLTVACSRRDVPSAQPPGASLSEVTTDLLAAPPSTHTLATVLPSLAAPAAAEKGPSACGENMVLVEGNYCPEVEQRCLKYMDPPGRYEFFRCAEYAPSKCLSKAKKKMRFCMDRDEYVAKGETLPLNDQSWTMGTKACAAQGKRMCMESEYNFACEGEEMRPYPYGFKRDATACNADQFDVVGPDGKLRDLRVPADAYPRCVSPFGVRNLAGNLEEFVTIDGTTPEAPAMKGAYWQPSRNFCRAAQTAHDRFYHGAETGFRCCSDAK